MSFAQNCTEKYHRFVAIQEAFVHFIHLKILLIIVVQTDKCPVCVLPFHQLLIGIINPYKCLREPIFLQGSGDRDTLKLLCQRVAAYLQELQERWQVFFGQTRSQRKRRRNSCEFQHFHFNLHSRLIFQLFRLFPPTRDQAVINNRTRQRCKMQ